MTRRSPTPTPTLALVLLACSAASGVAATAACGGDGGDGRAEKPAVPGRAVVRDALPYAASRLILFAGQAAPSLAPRARPVAPVSVEPALPRGLTLDRATGAVRGAAREPAAGQVHVLRDARGATSTLWIEVLPRPDPRTSRFVSPAGSDDNPGTIDRPFRSVARGIRDLGPGRTLFLRAGVYHEALDVHRLQGRPGAPAEIRSYPGERAVIDASEPIFADDPAHAWRRARGPGAHPDEWVSAHAYPAEGMNSASRGAFLDRPTYTRLLTYGRIEDLRAANQTWGPVGEDDERPGPAVHAGRRGLRDPERGRVPWAYFGPGIFFDADTGLLHIRLSPTAHGVAGLEEYRGPTDPRELRLAISRRDDRALGLFGSHHVRVTDLGLYHGGDETVRIQGSSDIVLDHVELRAATSGLFLGQVERVRVLHSRIDGGIPPWSFRSDYKGNYKFAERGGEVASNNLVRKTQRVLLYMGRGNVDVEIAYCEIARGHDVYVSGTRTDFHHNAVHDIQDDAFFLESNPHETGQRIHHNVVERAQTGFSFAGRGRTIRYVYRNLIDLRQPTAGYRPSGEPGRDPWRYGLPFKNTANLGALFFYQNTVLLSRPPRTPFLQFSAFENDPALIQRRWFVNNLFVIVQPDASSDKGGALVPPPSYLALRGTDGAPLLRSDGNLWVRRGPHERPLFRCAAGNRLPACGQQKFWRVADLRAAAGGFEAESAEAEDPGFRRAPDLEHPARGDDLRPGPASGAIGRGVPLSAGLPDPDRSRARGARPDAGALSAGQPLLRVGVDASVAY